MSPGQLPASLLDKVRALLARTRPMRTSASDTAGWRAGRASADGADLGGASRGDRL